MVVEKTSPAGQKLMPDTAINTYLLPIVENQLYCFNRN